MHRTLWRAAVLAGAAAAVALAAPAAAVATAPHIKATPDNLMVNTTTVLTGRGFPAHTTIDLAECGATTWTVPQDACAGGGITVTTGGGGGFTATYRVSVCPRLHHGGGPVTRVTCYIGEPRPSGVDTVTLVGAVKVIVTYP